MTNTNYDVILKLDDIERAILKARIAYAEAQIDFYKEMLELHRDHANCWGSK